MSQPSISVWFVCKLCRSSYPQVDEFIEHKKEEHFTQFENTNCIVFEEMEEGALFPAISSSEEDPLIVSENNGPRIKIEVNDAVPAVIPVVFEKIRGPKRELINYESELTQENENNYIIISSKEPSHNHNPYVLLKRLSSEEIQNACDPLALAVEKSTENQPTTTVVITSIEQNTHLQCQLCSKQLESDVQMKIRLEQKLQLQCQLCSKQLESVEQLKIHVEVCAPDHEDRDRYCVTCNRKFSDRGSSRRHYVRYHGTDEERSSLFRFKCQFCPKQYLGAADLAFHLVTHKEKKRLVKNYRLTSNFKYFKPVKCSHPKCYKIFRNNSKLLSHVATVHLGVRPFTCPFPDCNQKFTRKHHMEIHQLLHTCERPFKCSVEKCKKTFTTTSNRAQHERNIHSKL